MWHWVENGLIYEIIEKFTNTSTLNNYIIHKVSQRVHFATELKKLLSCSCDDGIPDTWYDTKLWAWEKLDGYGWIKEFHIFQL